MNPRKVAAQDGTEIAGCFNGEDGNNKGAVLIVPAMGTPQSYYANFATWLSGQGYPWPTIEEFLDSEMGEITLGAINRSKGTLKFVEYVFHVVVSTVPLTHPICRRPRSVVSRDSHRGNQGWPR